jgi:phosphoribosylanthranilate isomerase
MTRVKDCGLSRGEDVDSRVESAPGVKGPTKLRAFLTKADPVEGGRVPQ